MPHGRFLTFNELRYHPQVVENGEMPLTPTPHWGRMYHDAAPWQFSKSDPIEWRAAPLIGEHTAAVLRELGVEAGMAQPAAAGSGE